jgi:glutamate racemase
MSTPGPIGVFDSGYGGLTVLREMVKELSEYDYLYLGDNARAPYGNRSFDTVYEYTLQCVQHLIESGCKLIVLACNTASAKALRTIQQKDLPTMDPSIRVLGVIRPTTEMIGSVTKTGHVGILGTSGTVSSGSYLLEIEKYFPSVTVHQQACPMWVPLIENNEFGNEGADYFIRKYLDDLFSKDHQIDTLVLGCTHYPLIADQIRKYLPNGVQLVSQGPVVAASLKDYLKRHPEMDALCSKKGTRKFLTTDDTMNFDHHAEIFFWRKVTSVHIAIH